MAGPAPPEQQRDGRDGKSRLPPAERKRLLKVVGPAVFLMVCEGAMLIQARPQIALRAAKGNSAQAAKRLSAMMGAGAAAEFLLNPVLAQLSDQHGRRPMLLFCVLGTALSRLCVFFAPRSRDALARDRVVSMALVTSFFSCIRAAQADLARNGSELAQGAGHIARFAGLAILVGPYLDMALTRVGGGDSRFSFLGAALMSLAAASLLVTDFRETLDEDKRKPFDLWACNPFSFVSLLGSSKVVATLMGVILLQSFGDGRNIQEVNTVFMRKHLRWGRVQASNMIAAYGAVVVIGALFVKKSISALGLRGHTSLANVCQIAGSALWGLAPAQAPWDVVLTHLSLLLSVGSQRKRDAVESVTTRLLTLDGSKGKGQVAAALSNWRSLAAILGPIAFGNAFAWATAEPNKRYLPGTPYFMVAGLTLAAEQMFRSLSDEEMLLDEEGSIDEEMVAEATARTVPERQSFMERLARENTGKGPGKVFLSKSRQRVALAEKIILSHDTRIFRFALPESNMVLGLPIGKHIKLWCPNPKPVKQGEWNGRPDPEADAVEIERKYTPSSSDDDLGYIDIVIKVYRGGVLQRFPDGGKMSQHLDSMSIGDEIDIAGPFGLIEYHGMGEFTIRRKRHTFSNIGMMAGGTGITPMLQLIRAILKNPNDRTKVALLFANQTEDDILVRDMLEAEAAKHPDRFRVWYTLDRPPPGWSFSTGFITEEMITHHMPPNRDGSVILMCGPPPMIKFACKANLDKIGYPKDIQVDF